MARVRAYAAAGADAIFLAGVQGPGPVAAIADAVGLPLIVAGSDGAHPAVRMALQGHQAIMAAVGAVFATMQALRDGRAVTGLPDPAMLRALTRAAAYDGWQQEFLGG